MGEMADFAIDSHFEEEAHYERYKDAPIHVQYEEGLIDEHGGTIGRPWDSHPVRSSDRGR